MIAPGIAGEVVPVTEVNHGAIAAGIASRAWEWPGVLAGLGVPAVRFSAGQGFDSAESIPVSPSASSTCRGLRN